MTSTPFMRIEPERGLVDKELKFVIGGFKAGEKVTVKAHLKDLQGNEWASSASFQTSQDGFIDLTSQAPEIGGYGCVDAMGLVWSMQLVDRQVPMSGFISFDTEPYAIHFQLETSGHTVVEKSVERLWKKAGVQRQVVREKGLFGTFFFPSDGKQHPGLIHVSGSGGGLNETRAALFASHGYATLALAYFNYETLPKGLVDIPLEYFEEAIVWLQAHPAVKRDALGVTGASRGGELSLLLGSTFPQLRAVVAYVPSGLVWGGFEAEAGEPKPAWTWKGNPIAWMPEVPNFIEGFEEMVAKRNPIPLTPGFIRSVQQASLEELEAATIPVEKINGAVLLVSGEDDQMWPSTYFSKLVMERLEQYHFPQPYRHLSYPGAGHAIMAPYGPLPGSHSIHPVDRNDYAYGGNPKDHAFATADSWKQVLDFLTENLR